MKKNAERTSTETSNQLKKIERDVSTLQLFPTSPEDTLQALLTLCATNDLERFKLLIDHVMNLKPTIRLKISHMGFIPALSHGYCTLLKALYSWAAESDQAVNVLSANNHREFLKLRLQRAQEDGHLEAVNLVTSWLKEQGVADNHHTSSISIHDHTALKVEEFIKACADGDVSLVEKILKETPKDLYHNMLQVNDYQCFFKCLSLAAVDETDEDDDDDHDVSVHYEP